MSSVDISSFIRLFVNHRPVYGIGKSKIEQAFMDIIGKGQPPILRRGGICLTCRGARTSPDQRGGVHRH